MKTLSIFALAATLSLLTIGCSKGDSSLPSSSATTPVADAGAVQKASIVIDGGRYTPSALSFQKGKPVELSFVGGKKLGCGGTIVFKTLNMRKDVKSGETVVFSFTPKEAGEIPFTCGMDMYHGTVVVE